MEQPVADAARATQVDAAFPSEWPERPVRRGLFRSLQDAALRVRSGGIPLVDGRMNHAFLVTERQSAALDGLPRTDPTRGLVGVTRVPAALQAHVRDTAAVDLGNWHSMQYWAKWLDISEQQLVRATRVVGTSVATIEAYLAERRARRQRKRASAVAG